MLITYEHLTDDKYMCTITYKMFDEEKIVMSKRLVHALKAELGNKVKLKEPVIPENLTFEDIIR